MNQFDWEKMQEKLELTNVERINRSSWLRSVSEYEINSGNHLSGAYSDTWMVDDVSEIFSEKLAPIAYNPSGYILDDSTKYLSGNVADLTTDDGAYMIFRSYSSGFSSQTVYAHRETISIDGTSYYQLKLNSADAVGLTLSQSASTTGRKLLGRFVYSLTGITMIPANTWTVYYRAYKTGPLTVAHCDVDVLVRKADGTVRTLIATDVANSPNLGTSWSTVSATYSWSDYMVVDETDFLEVDYYAHVTTSQSNRRVYLRVDDSSLPAPSQTRIAGIMLPSEYTAEVEFTGVGNVEDWFSLTWAVDSCFSVSNVNVTLQLYNYSASQYSTSGDGYITYISSSTANTDETQTQAIITNPTHYRNSTGEWKIKIKGVKTTNSPFDLKVDWVEFQVASANTYLFDAVGTFVLDVSTYPLAYVNTFEIQIRYKASDSFENWFLKAYNWTSGQYSNAGFNSSIGHVPAMTFEYYAVNLTEKWQSYISANGTIRVKFCNTNPDANQTIIDIDFFGVRAVINGTRFTIKNSGASTVHVVSIWVINSTLHERYDANFFVNSGETALYIRVDISLPTENLVKIVTERGNIAVFSNH